MKKVLLIAAFAGMFWNCGKQIQAGPASDVPLVFESPMVNNQAKAVTGDIGTTYDIGENFRTWCWLSYSDIRCSNFTSDGTTPDGSEYFANVKAFHAGSNLIGADYWKLTPVYYWPKAASARLTLHALSPFDVTGDCSGIAHYWQASPDANKHVGFVVSGFTVKDNPANQYELLYSDFSFNAKRSDYVGDPYDESSDPGHSYNGINLDFNHALSAVQVKVKTDIDYEVYGSRLRIFLTGVKIKYAYKTGTFVENRKDNAYWSGAKPDYFESYPANTYKFANGVSEPRGPKWIDQGTEQDYTLYTEGVVQVKNNLGEWETTTDDIPMKTDGTWHVARNVKITRGTEIVFRENGLWENIRGHIMGTVPYEHGKVFNVTATGSDINILADGTYDILLNPTLEDGFAQARITSVQPDSYYESYVGNSHWSIHHTPGFKVLTTAYGLKQKDAYGNYYVGGQNLLAIPQNLRHAEHDVTLQVDYVIKYGQIDVEKTENISLYNLGDITEWEPRKRYIYTLTFSMDKMSLNPSVQTDWTDVNVGGN